MAAQRKTRSTIARATTVLLVLVVLPCQASARVFSFRASVPFQFVLGKQTLPAATYIGEVLLGQSRAWDATEVIVLKTPDGRVYRTAFTTVAGSRGRSNSPHSSLVFDRLRGKRYLTLVTMAGADLDLGISCQVPPDAAAKDSTEVPMETLR